MQVNSQKDAKQDVATLSWNQKHFRLYQLQSYPHLLCLNGKGTPISQIDNENMDTN